MLFPLLFAFLCTLSAVFALPLPANVSTAQRKRWYSTSPGPIVQGIGPWPVFALDTAGNTQQPVRYCYRDQDSLDELEEYVDDAIQKWNTAMTSQVATAFMIIADPRLPRDVDPLCENLELGQGQVMDALAISYKGKTWAAATSVGYAYDKLDRPYRHYIDFCVDLDDLDKDDAFYIASMTHELGHSIGLLHEHQRPDRDRYITFNCANIAGYDEAKATIDKTTTAPFSPDMSLEAKLNLICTNFDAGYDYLPGVLDFIRGDRIGFPWSTYVADADPPDLTSIMIYSSYQGSRDSDDDAAWGGQYNDAAKAPSTKDASRVAALYPLCKGSC
ncbi:hypothetical protein LTR36_002954 [Oleoguttula mirabilis]|uniref:Metalloendopeptidase n=1 Tax=Oleoguttula mirabilis TaxID=1507867 RepID=A0AAV9JWP8_9PEZI|nr:hypothetical protein LTR36_002954 [Oleoguttula mirabilis]